VSKNAFEGLSKTELLEKLQWMQQILEVMQVMRDWQQSDRLRTIGTILAAMCMDTDSDESQVERIQESVCRMYPKHAKVTEQMMDEELMTRNIRAALAKVNSEGSN
jgi:hypothetical protein